MNLDELHLHRTDLCLVREWIPEGETASGILLQHHHSLPKIFATVIRVPKNAPVKLDDTIVFARYAGESVHVEDVEYHFLNTADIEAVVEFDAAEMPRAKAA